MFGVRCVRQSLKLADVIFKLIKMSGQVSTQHLNGISLANPNEVTEISGNKRLQCRKRL